MGVYRGAALGAADVIDRFDELLRGWGLTWGPGWTLVAVIGAAVGIWLLGNMVVLLWDELEFWALAGLAGAVVIVALLVNWIVPLPGPWPAVLTTLAVAAAALAIAIALFAYAEDVALQYEDAWIAAAWAAGGVGAVATSLVITANFDEPRWLWWLLVAVIVVGGVTFVGAAGFGVFAVIHEHGADQIELGPDEAVDGSGAAAPPFRPALSSGWFEQRQQRVTRTPLRPGHQTLPDVLHLSRDEPEPAPAGAARELPWWRDQQRLAAWGVLFTLLNAALVFLTTLVKTLGELF